jgi:mannan endo-1,4-beta-mannosidase
MVMEEFGLGRDSGDYAQGTPTTARDRYYTRIFSILYDSARAGTPVAGSNFWGWGGEGKSQNPDFMWKKGDPFVGDPPQEPQGRNSIFISDVSTIDIIRDHAAKMKRLGVEDTLNVQSSK